MFAWKSSVRHKNDQECSVLKGMRFIKAIWKDNAFISGSTSKEKPEDSKALAT